jgi:cyclopropane-fatty-acyl-phospholipid synthase
MTNTVRLPGIFASQLFRNLDRLTGDCVRVVDGGLLRTFGDPQGELCATVVVHHPRFYRRVLLGGDLGAADSWIDGDWTCDDLTRLVRIFLRRPDLAGRLHSLFSLPSLLVARLRHLWRRNTHLGARRNIHEHYDLGNEFFELFLDDTLCYSCGVFERPDTSLDEASRAKLFRVCAKLDLQPTDRLVEIGSGWGGLAVYAAENFGCQVTTTTISPAQERVAVGRVRDANLNEQVRVLNRDYRDLDGTYDKLVSIEMIEAVGHEYFSEFFRRASDLLAPHGRMLLQAIVIKDQRFAAHLRTADFIRQHIFPGGCLPSVTALCEAMTQASDLRLVHLEEMSQHYVRTLQHWRERFWQQMDAVRQLGLRESFIRKWDYYLRYCEAAFAERQVNVVQMLLAKPECRLDPLTMALPSVSANPIPTIAISANTSILHSTRVLPCHV